MYWTDIASALEEMLSVPDMPKGLRPMLVQAIAELRQLKHGSEHKASQEVLAVLKDELRGRR